MRSHYVPEFYLRGFTKASGRKVLWVFEKPGGEAFCTQPDNIAVESNFYPADVERFLANEIEDPSNRILNGIRESHLFKADDKLEFSRYILAMIRRVPRHRERLYDEVMPDAIQETMAGWRKLITTARDEDRLTDEMYVFRMNEIDELEMQWENELPDELRPENRPPQVSEEAVDLLASMHWTFVIADGSTLFLTSDNPVFYTEGIGMAKVQSELMFPLSTRVALWIKHTPLSLDCEFRTGKQFLVREANKRTILNATRYVFYHKKAIWIPKLLSSQHLSCMELSAGDSGLLKRKRAQSLG